MSESRFPFRFGPYSCSAIIDAREIRPITTLTTSLSPEALAAELSSQGYSPTEVISDYNVLFMDTGKNLALVDSGWGCCTKKIQGRLVTNLQEAGFKPEDIDLVILTHGDRDHLGGLIDAQGKAVFPYASYVISQEAWDWYHDPGNLVLMPAEASEFYRNILPLLESNLRLVDGETEILPGLTMIPAPGHRPGHSVLRLTLGGKHLLHIADAVAHPLLMLHPDWYWVFDSYPDAATQTRRDLLAWAAENKAMLFGSHLPFPGLGTVKPRGNGWLWQPVEP